MGILFSISNKENIVLTELLAKRIADESERNLRRAILMLEACSLQPHPIKDNMQLPISDWELYIQQIVNVKCIPSSLIFHKLFTTILGKLDEHGKHKAIKAAAHFESRLNNGTRAIFHLEAFVANLMYIQKEFISYIS